MEVSAHDILYFILSISPCLILQAIWVIRKKTKIPWQKMVGFIVFLIFSYTALCETGIGTVWDIGKYDTIITLDRINLIPFSDGLNIQHLLNIVLFMPLGFMIPLFWVQYRTPFKTILTGAFFSIVIEVCQLFNLRATDIDDLLMNTLGTCVGYLIWMACNKIYRGKRIKSIALSAHEPFIYLALLIAGWFFLCGW